MPVVRINDATIADLKSIATWFGTKTPSETIDRIVREAMEQLGMERDDEPEATPTKKSTGAIEFESAPGLTFHETAFGFREWQGDPQPALEGHPVDDDWAR